jgi:signal transduction histidine kinase
MRAGEGIGTIILTHPQPGFKLSEKQLSLLQTFADQAVIAIENVRLFNETKESLDQQTATSEILRVISDSPGEVKPILDAVAERATRLCEASTAAIYVLEGAMLRRTAFNGPAELEGVETLPYNPGTLTGRTIAEGKPIHIQDLERVQAEFPMTWELAQRFGRHQTMLAVPLMRESRPFGTMFLRRTEVRPFTDRQIALSKVFADQAAIGIENVRLFNETKEALEQQKASAEVLGTISSSIADTKPVFDKIVESCTRLFEGQQVGILLVRDDGLAHVAAFHRDHADLVDTLTPVPITNESATGRAIVAREVQHYPDIFDGKDVPPYLVENARKFGIKSGLFAPMLWEGRGVGCIYVGREFKGEFTEKAVRLLKTFADQAVIAIQNARLFREIAEKGKQLEEASQHKSQFLASMSHELRTPLNAILGFNEMMLDGLYGELPGDLKEPLDEMQKSGKHLLRLINNVLDLAKIEAGRMELALADYSAHDIVENVRATLRPLAESKGLALGTSVPADLPLGYGDPGRLMQCLMNLAGNSLKFTKEGRVNIGVELDGGTQLRYRVTDTGIGIPPDKIGSLFTEFKQTDATIASEYGGTGLGLSITKKFVEMHGGRIWVESEQGKGSVFVFEIPLRVSR